MKPIFLSIKNIENYLSFESSKTKVFGKNWNRPKTTDKDDFWDDFLSRNSFQNQSLKTQPFMERYNVDLEIPVISLISVSVYCLVL